MNEHDDSKCELEELKLIGDEDFGIYPMKLNGQLKIMVNDEDAILTIACADCGGVVNKIPGSAIEEEFRVGND